MVRALIDALGPTDAFPALGHLYNDAAKGPVALPV